MTDVIFIPRSACTLNWMVDTPSAPDPKTGHNQLNTPAVCHSWQTAVVCKGLHIPYTAGTLLYGDDYKLTQRCECDQSPTHQD